MYTTGEVAKICYVSKRTVQYYDYEGIVQPSQILEHGKRVYSKEDIQKFQLVLLYKDLGLSFSVDKDLDRWLTGIQKAISAKE